VGLATLNDYIGLAVARGCRHYAPSFPQFERDPGLESVSNEELVALLLLGSNEFEPTAVRCAAQLSSKCDAQNLALVAQKERVGRALAYIAKQGLSHDNERTGFWSELLNLLGDQPAVADGKLPHWSRFVSQTGVTRDGRGIIQWLHCQ
jgi:hypothetical protein